MTDTLKTNLARILAFVATQLLVGLILAVPVMLLTDYLSERGWTLTPLGYWQSYATALLLILIIDGTGAGRRFTEGREG